MDFGREDELVGDETGSDRPKERRKPAKEDEMDFRLGFDGRGMPLGRCLFAFSAAV